MIAGVISKVAEIFINEGIGESGGHLTNFGNTIFKGIKRSNVLLLSNDIVTFVY